MVFLVKMQRTPKIVFVVEMQVALKYGRQLTVIVVKKVYIYNKKSLILAFDLPSLLVIYLFLIIQNFIIIN